ncbi:acyl-CoA dehydrogenase family protein [Alloalcanivorax xenomutans]|uniref:acyl-CoA dehydrogenase family protein n=1 Tax=Alloalcanivorax xenomutans TaxID=1094342 RepID=UPI0007A75524|nr:acyl-CoA dehydrogenase family protein [Alloalcanivorax xenomutans]ARB44315.1 acyl-CoA dehydrogenase [Alloalcanivorax xenomutans]KYZ84591.1 acyl-CoA dehydrogenase [Alcanivorax sp. KX64203]MBA4720923.1 acyl-CoA dehydrogenase family protein [Alcanivorax sp.]MCE7524350.1 acyl-CoA dehydrogenase family protein [Alloalcanivorax xenomutans]
MIRDPEGFQAFLNETRQWVKEVAIPAEERVEAADEIPEELVEEMRRRGFFGWSIPEQFGGAGLTTEELVLAAMELSQSATAFRARVGTNTGIGSEALVADGTDEQKAKYLPALARGEVTGCFALTEPDAGSDATALRTSAVRDGDDYLLNGTKCFITNAPIAGLFTVMARTDADDLSAKGISAFVVEGDTPGLSVGKAYKKMGQAGSPVSEVYFQDCRVPAANLIGGVEGKGFVTAMKVLNKQRLHLSALCTGPAMRMRDEALAHALKRRQFGQPIADFQLVQAMIADIQTEIHAARALILETARKRDQGEDIKLEASMCKYFASEMCGRVADKAVQIFGGAGYVADYSCIERLYRDARLFRLYEGTSQIHQLNIAKLTLRAAS